MSRFGLKAAALFVARGFLPYVVGSAVGMVFFLGNAAILIYLAPDPLRSFTAFAHSAGWFVAFNGFTTQVILICVSAVCSRRHPSRRAVPA